MTPSRTDGADGTDQEGNTMNNPSLFPMGEPNDAYARYFIGQSYLAPLLNKEIALSNVTFEPAETKHGHGATPHASFAHLAIMIPGADVSNEWLEPVDDETYYALDAEAARA